MPAPNSSRGRDFSADMMKSSPASMSRGASQSTTDDSSSSCEDPSPKPVLLGQLESESQIVAKFCNCKRRGVVNNSASADVPPHPSPMYLPMPLGMSVPWNWSVPPRFNYNDALPKFQGAPGLKPLTTVMFSNLPKEYCRDDLMNLLNCSGFACTYDLVHLPIDFRKRRGLGCATVNFISHALASHAIHTFTGFDNWEVDHRMVCEVKFGIDNQCLEDNVEYYRNREMMHPSVPDMYKPILLRYGIRVAFPPPTQYIKLPDHVLRRCK